MSRQDTTWLPERACYSRSVSRAVAVYWNRDCSLYVAQVRFLLQTVGWSILALDPLGPSTLQYESNRIQIRLEPIRINPATLDFPCSKQIDFVTLFIDIGTWRMRLTRSVRVETMHCAQLLALFHWLQYRFAKRLKRETLQRVQEKEKAKRSRTRRKRYRRYAHTGYSAWIRW